MVSRASDHSPARPILAGSILVFIAPLLPAAESGCMQGAYCPGVDVAASYTADFRRNTTGGIARGNAVSGLLEAGAVWRSHEVLSGAYLTTSVSLINVSGDGISRDRVGDLQGLNNIEADAGWYLYDLWTEMSFGADRGTSVRAGFLDLNEEFDASDTSGFFISPPFGIGTDLAQTGPNGPAIFPVTALGLRFGGELGDALQWHLAAYEGSPGRSESHAFAAARLSRDEGALLIGEADFAPGRLHKLALGMWSYTATFERIDAVASGDAGRARGNRGAYGMIDAPMGALGGARIDGVLRAGIASARFNAVQAYVGAAVVACNLIPGRPDDGVGIAVAHARTGSRFRNQMRFDGGSPTHAETLVEATWRAPLTQWLAVVPSVQWIDAPGADRSLRNAFVAGLRFELSVDHSFPLLARQAIPAQDPTRIVADQFSH